MRRASPLFVLLTLLFLPQLGGQYFGQNKVKYSNFDFKILETEHFDVYYYEEERAAAYDVARMAERSYARLTRLIRHEFSERKPIILYASHSDFQQTNAASGAVGEGTGGFTDFLKHRNVLPMTGSYDDVAHVLQHEMVHQFQYDVWSGGRAGAGLQTLLTVNPPLWFVEGMAEYLSAGPVDPNTAMWLRDAAAEGKLPTIRQLETDPTIFPYRFGQALVNYVGDRWGDESLGAILSASRGGSLEGAFLRVIGIGYEQLGDQWRDAVQKTYLPQLVNQPQAVDIATPIVTEELSEGTLHLAPALSPDGTQVAYFSEKDFYFVDMYLAEVPSGKVIRRLHESTWSSDYETFRFINSAASWSKDGQYMAFAAKRGAQDDIVILEPSRNKEVRRISIELSGVTTPSWSPDGQRIVFTGYDGGLSDLFVIDADGSNLQRLTNDKYADLHPVWSPDGQTIAFTTDRGPDTDFEMLRFGNMRIATFELGTSRITVLPGMDEGKNASPQWSPDGASLAFISDRSGVSNVFLHDFTDGENYQLTDIFTGVQGVTPLSPAISWAQQADRLAFVYFQHGNYDIYSLDDPRSLKSDPWRTRELVLAIQTPQATESTPDSGAVPATPTPGSRTIYRDAQGRLRQANSADALPDSLKPPPPVSVRALNDSASLGLPDTATFTERDYKVGFSPDYVARPSIGYTRDNFGNGVFGGTTITLSDMLGDRQLIFSGSINGRIEEAQVLAAYSNISSRLNWATGIRQDPFFYFQGSAVLPGEQPFENVLLTQVRRIVLRSAFLQAAYPLSRFRRIEFGANVTNVDDALLNFNEYFDVLTGIHTRDPELDRVGLESTSFVQPSVAIVDDNTFNGFVGPWFGKRARLEFAPTFGGWSYNQVTADYRRYDRLVGPFTLATRAMYFGRHGRDADRFSIFLGSPDLIRGYTSSSYRNNECLTSPAGQQSTTGCAPLDQLVGTAVGVFNAEIRFPILSPLWGLSPLIPPVEGAIFFDAGVAWNNDSRVEFREREPGESFSSTRTPLKSVGASIRANLLGFLVIRVDYSKPLDRPEQNSFWTVSLGPTF